MGATCGCADERMEDEILIASTKGGKVNESNVSNLGKIVIWAFPHPRREFTSNANLNTRTSWAPISSSAPRTTIKSPPLPSHEIKPAAVPKNEARGLQSLRSSWPKIRQKTKRRPLISNSFLLRRKTRVSSRLVTPIV